MGTIIKRKRKDGSEVYRAECRMKKNGVRILHLVKTFPDEILAKAWVNSTEKDFLDNMPIVNSPVTDYELKLSDEWCRAVDLAAKQGTSWFTKMLNGINSRSRGKNRNCEIGKEELIELLKNTKGRCQVTGIPFTERNNSHSTTRPWMPSVDRINPSLGYIKGNVRVVCLAANIAMRDWGEDVLLYMAKALSIKALLTSD